MKGVSPEPQRFYFSCFLFPVSCFLFPVHFSRHLRLLTARGWNSTPLGGAPLLGGAGTHLSSRRGLGRRLLLVQVRLHWSTLEDLVLASRCEPAGPPERAGGGCAGSRIEATRPTFKLVGAATCLPTAAPQCSEQPERSPARNGDRIRSVRPFQYGGSRSPCVPPGCCALQRSPVAMYQGSDGITPWREGAAPGSGGRMEDGGGSHPWALGVALPVPRCTTTASSTRGN